jgi:hypothetical protein
MCARSHSGLRKRYERTFEQLGAMNMTAVRAAFLNAWPVAAIGVSVAVNVAWIAGLGYGLSMLF